MGNASSTGCFPSRKSKKAAAAEQPAAEEDEPVEELSDLEEESQPSGVVESSPAPPLVMVDIKEKKQIASHHVKNEWYEFGVDEKVCEILRQVEMEHYIPNFAFHQIEFGTLPHLTVEDLKDMNVNRVGHRRKLLSQFQDIRE
ncbi:hypothetical protein A3770_03p26310 [Chloropicon primus]|uniref:SAM domain-containing protein n=1 Tax=Chloropicon primus TaxID=1764295 RepID=A0A5B8MI36_9CHLO|nr:hypothetical protein A3770_03p26310 [Chloropicon primus]|mmetsp:Transcript_14600/g.41671  ORF Transcript_14600/g.41671 Transcript_14600/m.41671 type:complete len:143 (-) Transcript_14600:96-524(-)|eukprot:QDZ20113.1 hypothetical protein A3770_03p26310 [Chloropicon primus]